MLPSLSVLSLDDKGASLPNYGHQVKLWRQETKSDAAERSAALILLMGAVARQVCMAAGGNVIMDQEGAKRILATLHDYFAPETADSVYQEPATLLQFKRMHQEMGEYLAQSDLLRRKAESKAQMGGASPEIFALVLCVQNAPLCRPETTGNWAPPQLPDRCAVHLVLVAVLLDRMFWRRRRT